MCATLYSTHLMRGNFLSLPKHRKLYWKGMPPVQMICYTATLSSAPWYEAVSHKPAHLCATAGDDPTSRSALVDLTVHGVFSHAQCSAANLDAVLYYMKNKYIWAMVFRQK